MSEPRTCLVTGTNSGLGLAIALRLAADGHRVVGTVRSEEKAATLHEAARTAGVEVDHRLLDVTDVDGCAAVVDDVRPQVLVNNAGYGLSAPVELVSDDDARHIVETMLLAPVRLARLALPHQRAAGGGHTVMISSILGRVTAPMTGWYQATKHGLEAVTDALRVEVARDGVRVVLVEPGFFRTDIFADVDRDAERYAGQGYDETFVRAREALDQASFAMGDPESVARTVSRAVSADRPRARYLVGPDAQYLDRVNPWIPTAVRDRLARFTARL